MINRKIVLILLLATSAVACFSESRRPDKEKYTEVQLSAVVTAINYESREVTLAGPLGNLVTLEASQEIKRFREIEVGDMVNAVYTTMTRAEFRDPTPAEKIKPYEVIYEGQRGGDNIDPRAVGGAIVKAVVTLKQVDFQKGLVTILGPRGNYLTLPVKDELLLKDLKVGEVAVLTYAEAIAIKLDKLKVPSKK